MSPTTNTVNTAALVLLTLTALAGVALAAADRFIPSPPDRWEYMSLPVAATGAFSDVGDADIAPDVSELDALGQAGWELVDVITEVETVHPNFGSSQYVTGLQPNTRADRAVLLFKRPAQPVADTASADGQEGP